MCINITIRRNSMSPTSLEPSICYNISIPYGGEHKDIASPPPTTQFTLIFFLPVHQQTLHGRFLHGRS